MTDKIKLKACSSCGGTDYRRTNNFDHENRRMEICNACNRYWYTKEYLEEVLKNAK